MYNLFTYGILRTNNKSEIVKRIIPFIKNTSPAKIYGYKLIVDDNGFYPSIIKSENKYDYVVGELIMCSQYDNYIKILDIVDSLSDCFIRRSVIVKIGDQVAFAESYQILDSSRHHDCNYQDYYEYLEIEKKLSVNT